MKQGQGQESLWKEWEKGANSTRLFMGHHRTLLPLCSHVRTTNLMFSSSIGDHKVMDDLNNFVVWLLFGILVQLDYAKNPFSSERYTSLRFSPS